MTWLFSQALLNNYENSHYSPEPAAESSADTCSDGEPSAQWNVMPTPQGFWRNDKMMDASRLSRFGPTCAVLTASRGEAVLMSFLADFPARTSAQPVEVKGSEAQDPDFGLSSLESLAKYDPELCLWKTPQYSLLGDSDEFSETWPRWGTMRNGECWAQPTWALRTSGTESGLWQTPVSDDAANRERGKWNSRGEPKLSAQVMLPTPCAVDSGSYFNQSSSPGAKKRPTLGAMAKYNLWPIPTVCGNYNRKGLTKTSGDGLATAVKNWPTPVASMSKGSSPASLTRKSGKDRTSDRLGHAVMASDGGQLNPPWVEWLMGWPIGWTDLKPLVTVRFHEWQQQHSKYAQT